MNDSKHPAAPAQKTLQQRRAGHAWQAVKAIVRQHVRHETGKAAADETAKKYGGQAKRLSTRIMAAGLGQALAFLYAKRYTPDLLRDLGDWVLNARGRSGSRQGALGEDALLEAVVNGHTTFLRWATDEVLAYLAWLNRFAEAEGLSEDAGD